jgi:hypothetical protein
MAKKHVQTPQIVCFCQGLESVPQAEAATEREAEISDLKQWNCQHSFPPGHWEPVFFSPKKKTGWTKKSTKV